uniref:Odorant receptor n=1 Tax=Locusta migratoria TaxID=7004 RepID=A0A0M4IUK4_LOCMI|nr:odorant receptor 119 [Locusta migratoria]
MVVFGRGVEAVLGPSAKLLRLLGLWSPQKGDTSHNGSALTGYLTLALIFGLMVTSALKLLMDRPRELDELGACIFIVTMLAEVFFKMLCFVVQRPTLHKLVQLLTEIRADGSTGERNDEIRRGYQILVDRMFLLIMVTATATQTLWAAAPVIYQPLNEDGEVTRLLPLSMWLPLDMNASPNYEVIYLVQVLLMPLASASLLFDFVFIDLMVRIAAELEILDYSFSGLSKNPKSVSATSKNEFKSVHTVSDGEINLQLAKNVKHHQEILRSVDLLEEAMNTGVFIQFLASTIAISCNIFAATSVTLYDSQFKQLIIILLIQSGLYCIFGQVVTDQSEKLMHSAYSCEWVDCDTRFRRSLLTFSVGATRPIEFTVGRMYKLSRETFLQVLQGSYAMFNMLYTFQSNR